MRSGSAAPRRSARIAASLTAGGTAARPHPLPELSGQLALTLDDDVLVEDAEDAGFAALGALTDPCPVAVADGRLTENPHLGLGMRFRDEMTS